MAKLLTKAERDRIDAHWSNAALDANVTSEWQALLDHADAADERIAELEAERQATIEAVIPPNRDKCSCGHPLVWQWAGRPDATLTGPSTLMCPRCVLKRAKQAEAERDGLLKLTRLIDEHPEDWDGPCECRLCMRYAAQDV